MSSKTILRKLVFSVVALAILPQLSVAQEVYRGINASEIINHAEVVRTSAHSNLPSFVKFNEGHEVDIDGLNLWLKKNFQLAPGIDWKLIGTEKDHAGDIHYRYQQTWNGVSVDAAVLIAHTKNDQVYSFNGNFYQNFTLTTAAGTSEATALMVAMDYVGAESYKWEQVEEEEHIKWEQNDESATYFPAGELVLVSEDYSYRPESFKLAWKLNIYAHEPISRNWIYVDANTGEVIQEDKILVDADEAGTAMTQYSGSQTIIADSFSGGYRLRDGTRGLGVRTWDMNTGTSYGAAVDFEDDDNNWNNVNPQLDEYATDAHFGAEMTYDYYWLTKGRNSIDDAGFQLNSYVHYSTSYTNAFWDGTRMTYGDGGGGYTPLTSMDIAAHEITHGLTTFTAGLIYNAESGALNESFSDIFGTTVENYATPSDWDWLIGEDIGSAFRNMQNPNAYGDPDTYFGDFWASLTGGDSGGVHTNSGVQNFWYYLLQAGGSGTNDNSDVYTVVGQGWDVASSVAFRNLTVYLVPGSQFIDGRFYAIQSAIDLYGACSPEVESVTNAWYAVGVGVEYTNEVIADFTSTNNLGCQAPWTVDFTNNSVNGTSFNWDFGDGGTSTATNPSYTYTAEGTYTVTLNADGGACGADDTINIDFVVVDAALPCIVNMPTSGTGDIQTSCDGTLFDSGGSTADYGANELAQITISPTGASTVNLDFIFFDVESGTAPGLCDYDYLEVYDGPNTASPLIDRYCNTNNPPATLTSTNGSVTIVFSSDPGLEEPGFEIAWTCNMPTVVPNTDFVASVTTTCTGTVKFTDLTTEGPLTWDWDFGDGGTSTDQNPTYTYASDGIYTVTLATTNGIGPDDEIKVAYITVDKPDAPIAVNDTICVDNSATLDATGSGILYWYNAPVGGVPLFSGSPYVTAPLTVTTSYWVEDQIDFTPVNEGPVDNTFGGGGFFTGNQYLIFDCTTPVVLNTVKVYANGTSSRTIELRNSFGTVLESMDVLIANGEQTVTLAWNIPVGTNYQLGTLTGSSPDLYRNNSGPSYPYNISGLVEITNSSAGGSYYYFFYDWEIQEYPCISERTEVIGEVGIDTTILIDPAGPFCPTDAPFTMTTIASGGTWSASCGGCINATTGDFDPSLAGIGDFTIDYIIPGYCGSSSPLTVTVEDDFPVSIDAVGPLCHEAGTVFMTTSGTGGTWSADCGACIDATTGEFDPTAAGDGTWTITYNLITICDHSNSITVDVITCLGLSEGEGSAITIFPNPAKEMVTINSANLKSGTIVMTDVLGRIVINKRVSSNKTEIDLSDLQARSTYFIKILNDDGQLIAIRKLIKS